MATFARRAIRNLRYLNLEHLFHLNFYKRKTQWSKSGRCLE